MLKPLEDVAPLELDPWILAFPFDEPAGSEKIGGGKIARTVGCSMFFARLVFFVWSLPYDICLFYNVL